MDRSDHPLRRCGSDTTQARRVVTRRSVLLAAAGSVVLASAVFAGVRGVNDLTMRRSGTMDIKRNGSRPSGKGPEAWFTGTVRVDPLFQVGDPTRLSGGQVTFEAGARTMWHTHPLGQTLIVTSGLGWVQCEGWADRGNPSRRRHLVSARREALAWRDGDDRDDPYRHYGIARRQQRRLDGKGQRRAIPQMSSCAGCTPTQTNQQERYP